jgi:AcrR family transcriptional regulator
MADPRRGERPLRADAERNRSRILAAARAAFAEHGLGVALTDIADRAGVGIATVYRRFPARSDLIAACFAGRMTEYANSAQAALAHEDPWMGFCAHIQKMCALQAADRGLGDLLIRTFPGARALESERSRATRLSGQLVERAISAGRLRQDFAHQDIALILMANAGVVQAMGQDALEGSRRFVGLVLEALRADRASPLPPPPSPSKVLRAMRAASESTPRGGQ